MQIIRNGGRKLSSRLALATALLAAASVASAQEGFNEHDNSIQLEYFYIHTGDFQTATDSLFAGITETHVVLLSGTYALSDKWKIFGRLPYIQKRHDGNPAGVHDWRLDFVEYTPPDLRVVDDGNYHGGLQDVTAGVQYLALDGPLRVSPFVSYGVPTRNYPIYGSAVIGRGLKELHVGVALEFTPYFSDWFFQADVAYAFSERVVGVNPSYWRAYLSASYYLTPRFAPRVFINTRRSPNGLRYPEDFEPFEEKYDSEYGWRHDQTLKHEFVDAGIGFDYIVNDRYEIGATFYRTIEANSLFEIDYAFTFDLTRRF